MTAKVLNLRKLWVIVRCPVCGKVSCEAAPGSTVRFVCRKCKEERIVNIAAC